MGGKLFVVRPEKASEAFLFLPNARISSRVAGVLPVYIPSPIFLRIAVILMPISDRAQNS